MMLKVVIDDAIGESSRLVFLLMFLPILAICGFCIEVVNLAFFLAGFPGWLGEKLDQKLDQFYEETRFFKE